MHPVRHGELRQDRAARLRSRRGNHPFGSFATGASFLTENSFIARARDVEPGCLVSLGACYSCWPTWNPLYSKKPW